MKSYKKELPTTINKMVESEYRLKNLKTKRKGLYKTIALVFFAIVLFAILISIVYIGGAYGQ